MVNYVFYIKSIFRGERLKFLPSKTNEQKYDELLFSQERKGEIICQNVKNKMRIFIKRMHPTIN